MLKVFKYDCPIDDDVSIDMPKNARVLSVQTQGGLPRIWALVNPELPVETRRFHWRGTGHTVADGDVYIGTIQLADGQLVFHLFDADGVVRLMPR